MRKKQFKRDFDFYIDEYMYNCRSRKLRPKTMISYEQSLRLFERWCLEESNITEPSRVLESTIRFISMSFFVVPMNMHHRSPSPLRSLVSGFCVCSNSVSPSKPFLPLTRTQSVILLHSILFYISAVFRRFYHGRSTQSRIAQRCNPDCTFT